MKIALVQNGRYLTAEEGGGDHAIVTCNRVARGPWETWTVEDQGDGTIALRSCNGRYLCAESGGGAEVRVDRQAVGPWERFTLSTAGPHMDDLTVELIASSGDALRVGPGPEYRVWARPNPDAPSRFTVETVEVDAAPAPQPAPAPAPPPQTPAPRGSLTRLRAEGFHLVNDAGRWFGVGATLFLAYFRFLTEGADAIRPVLAQLEALGFTLIRVLGMVDSFAHWYPQEHPDYYSRIPEFLDLCAEYGLYVLWDAFADTRRVMPDLEQQHEHWARTCDALRARANGIVSKGNELNQHDNAVDAVLAKPVGLLASSGSYGGQPLANPPMPVEDWDLGLFHQRRDYPKAIVDTPVIQLRLGDTVDGVAHHVPIGLDEPPGFGEEAGPHNRWTDEERARELRFTAEGTAAFIIYHSDAGILAQLLGPTQTRCAAAFTGRG